MAQPTSTKYDKPGLAYSLLLVAGLILFAAFTFHCGPTDSGKDRFVLVKGYVLEDSSNAPIDSAWISVRDTSAHSSRFFTDSTEFFFFSVYQGASFYMYAGKPGYHTARRWTNSAIAETIQISLQKF